MADHLLNTNDQFVNPPQLVTEEPTWSYLHSHKTFDIGYFDQETDYLNLAKSSANQNSSSKGQGASASAGSQPNAPKKEPIERFASIIDVGDPKFEKHRQESIKTNIGSVSNTCGSMINSLNSFYHRKVECLDSILTSNFQDRAYNTPQAPLHEHDEANHVDLALAPWNFQSLPGTKPQKWPDGLLELAERLDQLADLAFWHEPLDIVNYGREFLNGARSFIEDQTLALGKMEVDAPESEDARTNLGLALRIFVRFAVLSGSNEWLMEGLSFLAHVESSAKAHSQKIFDQISNCLKTQLKKIQTEYSNRNTVQFLDTANVSGLFSVAKFVSFAQQHEHNTSITTDGDFIYMFMAIPQKVMMYKIGTGTTDATVPGKIYLEKKCDREGDVSWVYCRGVLYARRINEEFGVLSMYDPATFNSLGEAKMLCNDIFSSSQCQQTNRNYPMLTDGEKIFIVTMKVTDKQRKVKEEMAKSYEKMIEEKARQLPTSERDRLTEILKEQQKLFASKGEKSKDFKEIAMALDNRLVREEEIRSKAVAKDRQPSRARGGGRQSGRGGRGQARGDRRSNDRRDDQNGEPKDETLSDPRAYRVCQFYLHEFTLEQQPEMNKKPPVLTKEEEELADEIQSAFCGFFSAEECNFACKNQTDICEAAFQLASDAEEHRFKDTLPLKKSVLLCESLITSDPNQKNEGSLQVADDSLLHPNSIHSGKWVINGENLIYAHNIMQQDSVVHVFSMNDKDEKQISRMSKAVSTASEPNADSLQITSSFQMVNEDTLFMQVGKPMPPSDFFQDPSSQILEFADMPEPALIKERQRNDDDDDAGDAQQDPALAFFQAQAQMKALLIKEKPKDGDPSFAQQKDMFEDIELQGTHCKTVKNFQGINCNYRGTMTYHQQTKKYYILMLANQQRNFAVVSDLHRFGENFREADEKATILSERRIRAISSVPEFISETFSLLKSVELERFNMKWRWNSWSNQFKNAYKSRSESIQNDSFGSPSQFYSLKNSESQAQLQTVESAELKAQKEKDLREQRQKQLQKIKQRLLKIAISEVDIFREEFGFQEDPEQVAKTMATLEKSDAHLKQGNNPELDNLESMHYVMPEEKILVHGEYKKVFTFCQVGSPKTLKYLFNILKIASKISGGADLEKLKFRVLSQILIWATFASQLSGLKPKDAALLDEVSDYFEELLRDHTNQTQSEADLTWKILLVGWNYFCRTASKQAAITRLVFSAHERFMKTMAENKAAVNEELESQQTKPVMVSSPHHPSREAEVYQGKNLHLQTLLSTLSPGSTKFISPLELFYTRFYRFHASFYDLEVLNRSTVKTFAVLLEVPLFKKVFRQVYPQKKKSKEEASSAPSAAPASGKQTSIIEPLARKALQRTLDDVFSSYKQVPISLRAIPSKMTVNPSSGLLPQATPSKGKKGKKSKNVPAHPASESQDRIGFAMEEIHLASHFSLRTISGVSTQKVHCMSSNNLSMPLGTALIEDSSVIEGTMPCKTPFANTELIKNTMKRNFDPLHSIRMYDSKLYEATLDKPKNERVAALGQAQETHKKAARALLDTIINLIAKMFDLVSSMNNNDGSLVLDQLKKQLRLLVKSFVSLAQSAQVQGFYLSSSSDLDFANKVVKLIQRLLEIELNMFEAGKSSSLNVSDIEILIRFLVQKVSLGVLNDQQNIPLIGYSLLPGLIDVIHLLKETFMLYEQNGATRQVAKTTPHSLLDCLQVLTSEGIDFGREKVFETPHPYPQNEYSQSETIEVSKAIGFIVELDKRCSTEHSTDQLVMYSGSDHIFHINSNFATQIKLSSKPNSRQPYFLLGNRMKIDFRSYSHRRKGHGSHYETGSKNPQSSQMNEHRWGYRVIIRPIYSEPQNILLNSHFKQQQRKIVYQQFGGEENCHSAEITLNGLVCLASQFAKDMANVESFVDAKDLSDSHIEWSFSSVKSSLFQKMSKQQLFKGGIMNSKLLEPKLEEVKEIESTKLFNYHEDIQKELKLFQTMKQQFSDSIQDIIVDQYLAEDEESKSEKKQDELPPPGPKLFLPNPAQWSKKVKDLLECASTEKGYTISPTPLLNDLYAKIREFTPYPIVVRQRFFLPSAKKHKPEWEDVEKIMIVALLFHSQSLDLVEKLIEVKAPNLRSSAGAQIYDARPNLKTEESYFLIDQMKLIGNQVNDLLMWLILRVQGEIDAQNVIQQLYSVAQSQLDDRLAKKKEDQEKEKAEHERRLKERQEQEEARKKELEEQDLKKKEEPAPKKTEEELKKEKKKAALDQPVVSVKNRKIKRGKIVRSAIDTGKASKAKKAKEIKKPAPPAPKEQAVAPEPKDKVEPVKKEEEEGPKFADLTLLEINNLKNQIEQKSFADLQDQFLGSGADPHSLKPLCQLFNLKYNAEDPTETVRQVFKKIKGRVSHVIDLDNVDNPKLPAKFESEAIDSSPYVEVCKDVKSRILILFEIRPSIEYLHNVTKVDHNKCFSRYGSIKLSQRGGLLRQFTLGQGDDGRSQRSQSQKELAQHSQQDDEHDDELVDIINEDDEDEEKLAPLNVERSKSVQMGIKSQSFKPKKPSRREQSRLSLKAKNDVKDYEPDEDSSAGDWLQIHRKWKQWNRFHKNAGLSGEDKDLTSPFCSPLYSVLQFAKNSDVTEPSPIRSLLCEQKKRAAFRLFGMKNQSKLYDLLNNTPYQRFIWGSQSKALGSSALENIEACGEGLANKINERSKKQVKQIMSYIVTQSENMKQYQDILEKYLKQNESKGSKSDSKSGSKPSKPSSSVSDAKQDPKTEAKQEPKSEPPKQEKLDGKQAASKQASQKSSESADSGSQATDRRFAKITFDEFIPWQMKTVMHSLNDLRVLLSDSFTQVHVLEALKEDQFKIVAQTVDRERLTAYDGTSIDNQQQAPQNKPLPREADLGFQNIKQFLKALISVMILSNSSSSFAEQFPNSSKLCQQTFKVSNIVLQQFVSDKQQIREAETSKILQEMMLEILVSHLERVCGVTDSTKGSASAPGLAKSIEDTNIEEIVQLLKLLQDIMRISQDTQRALQQHMKLSQNIGAVDKPAHALAQQQPFLSEGSTQVMRCARLLSYLMVEFQVPLVVRHSIRCAKIFFFGLVNFENLKLYDKFGLAPPKQAEKEEDSEPPQEPILLSCVANKFILHALQKIGMRISCTDSPPATAILPAAEEVKSDDRKAEADHQEPQPSEEVKADEGKPSEDPEASEKPKEEGESKEEAKPAEEAKDAEDGPEKKIADSPMSITEATPSDAEDLDKTSGKKYVVYANINSQNEDYTFLVTALYHWENLYPVIQETQPTDPKPFQQKNTKKEKMKLEKAIDQLNMSKRAVKKKDDKRDEKKDKSNDEKKDDKAKDEEGKADDKAKDEKPAEDKPAEDKPGEEKKPEEDLKDADALSIVNVEPESKSADKKQRKDEIIENVEAESKSAEAKPAEDKPVDQLEAKPAEDKPAKDKPAEDKPAEAKPAEDKPAEDKPAEDKPAEAQPAEEKPAEAKEDEKKEEPKAEKKADDAKSSKSDKKSEGKPEEEKKDSEAKAEDVKSQEAEKKEVKEGDDAKAEDKPAAGEKPSEEDKPAQEDKPAEDKPAEEKLAENKPAEEKPAEDKPAEDKPVEEKPVAEDKPAAKDKLVEDKPVEEKKPEDDKQIAEEVSEQIIQASKTAKENFEFFKKKKEAQDRIDNLLKEIERVEENKDLHELLDKQQERNFQYIINDIAKRSDADRKKPSPSSLIKEAYLSRGKRQAVEKRFKSTNPFFGGGEPPSKSSIQSLIKGSIVGNNSQMQEINLVPNRVLIGGAHSHSTNHSISMKLSINSLQNAYIEIAKQTQEVIYDDDTPAEQTRKLKARNFKDRVLHHLFQALCLAGQLNQRYSVPLTEPMSYKDALEFGKLIDMAYKEQIEPVPVNPFTKEDLLNNKLPEGKKVSQYFPFTLKNVMAGVKQPELPPGHAPPVVIYQKTLVISLMTEKHSKDIEKVIEARGGSLKQLEKNPQDGFRMSISKNNIKRQGSSVSSCIQTLIQFLRETIVGDSKMILNSQDQADSTSQKSSVAGQSESTHGQPLERADTKMINNFMKQQELRQSEIMTIINESLQLLKSKKWTELAMADRQITLGLFAVIGGWYGLNRIVPGSQVLAHINNCWSKATVVDEGAAKRKVSVLLNDDTSLQLVKVSYDRIKPLQTQIDEGINDKLNFDDLCSAITFLHEQSQAEVSLKDQLISSQVLFQMLLKVSSKLNWSKIDQNSNAFNQFRKILIQVTKGQQANEDKSKEYLEKKLIESWERVIDRNEVKNLDFFAPIENPHSSKLAQAERKKKTTDKDGERLIDVVYNQMAPYIDTDFIQPSSSYLVGLPEPVVKKNQKEAALKLLFYWEKYVLPTTREFVRSTFQKWEMNYYFEQIRHHLRQGDQRQAISDAMILWENKVPNGVILPCETVDWTAKVADECIVDSWAIAKINFSKQQAPPSFSQQKQVQSSSSSELSIPLMIRLQNLGVQAIIIQIKFIDSRYNVVLGEFFDSENYCSHLIWFPISHLYELEYPMPPRAENYSRETIAREYIESIQNINSLYARKTLIRFFSSSYKALDFERYEQSLVALKKIQFEQLQLNDLISWSVQEEFANNPFNGWLSELNCAIPIANSAATNSEKRQSEASSNIHQLIEEASDKVILENLLKTQSSEQSSSNLPGSSPLLLIRELLTKAVKNLGSPTSESYLTIVELSDWVYLNWLQMSEFISQHRTVFDLCRQNQASKGGSSEGQSTQLIPIHSLVKSSSTNMSIATLMMFHKIGCNLTPCSKIQFYSDPNQVNLVSEIHAGNEAKTQLPPLLLNHGQIWAKFQQGSLALLRKEQQYDAQSSLPCAAFQIPKQWSVVCWLTDILTSAFLNEQWSDLALDIFKKLINSMIQFYQDSQSPQLIKSQVIHLLTRLLRKLRYILKKKAEKDVDLTKHLASLFISPEFIRTILNDMDVFKKEEESQFQPSEQKETKLLYSEFMQQAVEFMMTIIIPVNPHHELKSYQQLLSVDESYLKKLKEWMDPLLKTSVFMHYFNHDLKALPVDLLEEIHTQTTLKQHRALEHLLVIENIPRDEEQFPKLWLIEQVYAIVKKHHGRILDPLKDIFFEEDQRTVDGQEVKEYRMVLLLDGWSHFEALPDFKDLIESGGKEFKGFEQVTSGDYRNQFVELFESDSEGEEEADDDKKKKEEEDEEEIQPPTEWSCEVCTFINPMANGTCEICGGGRRPPMESLLEAIRRQRLEEKKAKAVAEEKPEEDEGAESGEKISHENLLRLKFLAFDLEKLVKVEQKRRKAKQEEERLERLCFEKELNDKKDGKSKKQKKKRDEESKLEEEKKMEESDGDKSDESIIEEENSSYGSDSESKESAKTNIEAKDEKDEEEEVVEEKEMSDGGEPMDPRAKKLQDLGYDISILDSDPQFAEALLASADLEEQQQDEERKKKEAEEAELKKKQEEEKKRKELEELKKQGVQVEEVQYISLKVHYGISQIQAAQDATRIIFHFLSSRVQDQETSELSSRMKQVLAAILEDIKQVPSADQIALPEGEYEAQLIEFGLSKEELKEMDAEELEQKCSILVAADIFLLFRFLECQGYDYWLQKQAYSSFRSFQSKNKVDKVLIEKLKEFAEVSFCEEKKIIQNLQSYQLRLLSKVQGENPTKEVIDLVEAKAKKAERQAKEAERKAKEEEERAALIAAKKAKEKLTSVDREKALKKLTSSKKLKLLRLYFDAIKTLGESGDKPEEEPEQKSEKKEEDAPPEPEIDISQPLGYFNDQLTALHAKQQDSQFWYNSLDQADLNYYWAIIKTFSSYFAISVPLINCSASIADLPEEGVIPVTLSAYMSSLRNLCLSNTKYELKHLILKKTSVEREKTPVLHFERLKLHSDAQSKDPAPRNPSEAASQIAQQLSLAQTSHTVSRDQPQKEGGKKNFIFTQAYEQMKDIDFGALRPPQPKGTDPHLSFEIYFKGEDVVGMGGPYRQFFSDISQELHLVNEKGADQEEEKEDAENVNPDADGSDSQYLGLLCQSRNMVRNSETGKDNFVLSPQKVGSQDLSLFNFLGVLMGVCIRTNTNLSINLPSLVWKQLVGQRLTFEDIKDFDDGIISEIQEILNITSDDDFEAKFGDRYFTTQLSDLSTIELEHEGSKRPLTFSNRMEYVRLVLNVRMKECQAQCEAIKQGICQIIPEALLNMVGHKELEEWIYGKKTIDIELLRRHTKFSKGYHEADKEIRWFWEILHELTQEDRRKFIRFCFAQSTIPPNDEEFGRRQIRFLIKPVMDSGDEGTKAGDQRLPKADTCFFNFELPRYSSKEVMKRQIIFAISFDNVSLNAEQQDMHLNDGMSHGSRYSGGGSFVEEEEEEE